jgi:hypothetical protein
MSIGFQTFPNPAAGQGFTITVPDDEEWRIWGGGCTFDADATVISRIPGIIVEVDNVPVFVHYNVDSTGTAAGPTANVTRDIVYFDQATALPRSFGTLPWMAGLPQMTLPPGATVEAVFEGMSSGDVVTDIGFLIETTAAPVPPIQPASGTFGFALRFD